MPMDKILQVVNNLAAEVFDRPQLQLKPSDSPSNVKGWDSLTQVVLVAEIEKEFKIKFTFRELASIMTIGDIVYIIRNKTEENLQNET
jgi:acyl carrier protein